MVQPVRFNQKSPVMLMFLANQGYCSEFQTEVEVLAHLIPPGELGEGGEGGGRISLFHSREPRGGVLTLVNQGQYGEPWMS